MDKKEMISWLQLLRSVVDEEDNYVLIKNGVKKTAFDIISEVIDELSEPEYIDKQVAINAIKKRKETIKGDTIGEMNVRLGTSYAIDAIEQIPPVKL